MRPWSLLIAMLALGIASAPVSAAPSDIAATHAYIQATYQLDRTSVTRIGVAQSQIESLNSKLKRECPHEGAGTLQNEASQPISALVIVAMWSIAYRVDAGPIRIFAEATKRLGWSNHAITRGAQLYARSLREMAALPQPDLCAALRGWRASNFQILPSGVAALVDRATSIELNPLPHTLLAPFARGADAGILARILRLEEKLEEAEFRLGQNDAFQIWETLALPQ